MDPKTQASSGKFGRVGWRLLDDLCKISRLVPNDDAARRRDCTASEPPFRIRCAFFEHDRRTIIDGKN